MNANIATFVKQLPPDNHTDARLYRLSHPVAIYEGTGATTDWVIVSKLDVANLPLPSALRALSRGCPRHSVAVFPADSTGMPYSVHALECLQGAEHTHHDALAAIGFTTVVRYIDESAAQLNICMPFENLDEIQQLYAGFSGVQAASPAPTRADRIKEAKTLMAEADAILRNLHDLELVGGTGSYDWQSDL